MAKRKKKAKAKRPIGRPPLTDAEREARRVARNQRQRDRRAAIRKAKDEVKAKLAEHGVKPKKPRVRKKGNRGAPIFVPTAEDRVRVETLAGLGMRHDEIALQVINPATAASIDESVLRKHFERELIVGPSKANNKVAASLFQMATGSGGVPRHPASAMFWAKCRMGWSETQRIEVDVKSGVLVAPAAVSPEDWVKAAQRDDQEKREPGKSE